MAMDFTLVSVLYTYHHLLDKDSTTTNLGTTIALIFLLAFLNSDDHMVHIIVFAAAFLNPSSITLKHTFIYAVTFCWSKHLLAELTLEQTAITWNSCRYELLYLYN